MRLRVESMLTSLSRMAQTPTKLPSAETGALVPTGLVDADRAVIELWLGSKRSLHTRRAYARAAGSLLAAARKPLGTISALDIQRWAEELPGAPNSRALKVSAVRSLYDFAVRMGVLKLNPAVAVPIPAGEDRRSERTLSPEQVRAILDAAQSNRLQRIGAMLLYFTGARAAEAVRVVKEDFKPRGGDKAQVKLTGKGEKTRFVPLGVEAWEALKKPVELLAPGERLVPWTPEYLSEQVKALGVAAGAGDISAHWLRHAFATHYMDRGGRLEVLQKRLGHESLATTGTYLHVRPDVDDALELAPKK